MAHNLALRWIICFGIINSAVLNCVALVPTPTSTDSQNKTKNIIPVLYLKEIRPPTMYGKPIEVGFSMRVMDINSVNVEDMDFRMDMFIKQEWQDPRIKISEEMFECGEDYISLPSHYFENLWQPDLYFLNSKVVEIATLTRKFSALTLFRNRTIRYTARMHALIGCHMEFQHYPMDTQFCPITVESFSYNINKMILRWSGTGVSITPELRLLQYSILPLQLQESRAYTAEKNGNFSRLIVYFRFERQIGHHLIQTFIPSTLVVVLSWFSFWLDLDAIPGRVTLLVTSLLTLVTMFTGLRSDIPPVAYVKALDLWMAGCMVAVFASLGEFVIAKVLYGKYIALKQKEKEEAKLCQETAIVPWTNLSSTKYIQHFKYKNMPNENRIKLYWRTEKGKEKIMWHEIDRISRTIFPSLFFLFAVIYWAILILGSRRYATM